MGEPDFGGKLKLPLPDKYDGEPNLWEEWSWNFKAYVSMFDTNVLTFLERAEQHGAQITDADLNVNQADGTRDEDATGRAVNFSRRLRYLLANLTTGSARLVVRQNDGANGFETWRRMLAKFSLPDATRHVSLLTQLLDFKFNPSAFEQDFNAWETVKSKYESQSGTVLPDSVLVATLLNKTTGHLQQHLRLNARTLTTYAAVRDVIVEYFRSRHILQPSASSQGPAPMDIGYLGKGKGKRGKGNKGNLRQKLAGKGDRSTFCWKQCHVSWSTDQTNL